MDTDRPYPVREYGLELTAASLEFLFYLPVERICMAAEINKLLYLKPVGFNFDQLILNIGWIGEALAICRMRCKSCINSFTATRTIIDCHSKLLVSVSSWNLAYFKIRVK